jgi:hypothetical protein
MVKGLGALIGYADGQWSWATAGTAWQGLGTFALALTPGMMALNNVMDLPGLPKGTLQNTLLGAGKALIAYDTWGEDKSKAAGMVTFNVVSAVLGTKGAGAALRGGGTAAQASKVALGVQGGRRGGQGRRLHRQDAHAHRPGRKAVASSPGFSVPHIDIPNVDTPTTHVDAPSVPSGGTSVGDAVGDAAATPHHPPPAPPSATPSATAPATPHRPRPPSRPTAWAATASSTRPPRTRPTEPPLAQDGAIGGGRGVEAPDAPPRPDAPDRLGERTPPPATSTPNGLTGSDRGVDPPNASGADAPARPAESTPGPVGGDRGFEPEVATGREAPDLRPGEAIDPNGVVRDARGFPVEGSGVGRGADAPATPAPHGAEVPARAPVPEPPWSERAGAVRTHRSTPGHPSDRSRSMRAAGAGGVDGPTAHTPARGGADVPPARGVETPSAPRGAEVPARAGVPDQPVASGGARWRVRHPAHATRRPQRRRARRRARRDCSGPAGRPRRWRFDTDPPSGRGPDAPGTPDGRPDADAPARPDGDAPGGPVGWGRTRRRRRRRTGGQRTGRQRVRR